METERRKLNNQCAIACPKTTLCDSSHASLHNRPPLHGHDLILLAGGLSLFNLYVALSRSSGQLTIRLLCDFDVKVFQAAHCPELLAENNGLETLNNKTLKEWRDAGQDTRNGEVFDIGM